MFHVRPPVARVAGSQTRRELQMTAAQLDILNVILGWLIAFVQDPRTVLIGVLSRWTSAPA